MSDISNDTRSPNEQTQTRLAIASVLTGLTAALVTVPAEAPAAEAATDYSITVDPARTGPAIDKSMYGVVYITTARTGLTRPHPLAGSLLVLPGAGQGLPATAFAG
ncbi:hypothetical protein [Streptomyces spiramyceticus]|uniref:hypothetical protein n=1 Tax=Streptomyces spiramyceticus TaxID=299717 RepID=UPI003B75C1C5